MCGSAYSWLGRPARSTAARIVSSASCSTTNRAADRWADRWAAAVVDQTQVDPRRVDGRLQVTVVKAALPEHEHQGGGDPVGAGGADGEHPAGLGAGSGRGHVGSQAGTRLEGVHAEPVELHLTQRVVQQDAGAGDDQPRAVAAAHRDRARVAVGVDRRDVGRGRRAPQRGEAVLTHLGQQIGPVGLEVAGEVVDRGAVGQHGPLDLDHVVPGPVAAPDMSAGELPEHDREHRATDRGRRVHRHRPGACAGQVGRADDGLVRRQVAGRDQPVVLGHGGGQGAAHLTGREQRRPLGRQAVQSVGEGVVRALLATAELRAALARDQGPGLGILGEQGVGDERQVARGGPTHRVGAGRGRRGLDQAGPGECGEALCGDGEGRDDARSRDRTVAGHHRDAAAVVGAHLADPCPNRAGSAPRPGISTLPSTTTGSPSEGQTET